MHQGRRYHPSQIYMVPARRMQVPPRRTRPGLSKNCRSFILFECAGCSCDPGEKAQQGRVSLVRPSQNVSRELIREKCSDFASFQVWPLRSRMDPRAWLQNFEDGDQELAHHLLNAFVFFSSALTAQLFLTALQNLSASHAWRGRNTGDIFAAWRSFIRKLNVTHVTGETPKPTDSGNFFTRIARDRAGIPDDQIIEPGDALRKRVLNGDDRPLIFVDDFMGSGEQFLATWRRRHAVGSDRLSFEDVAARCLADGNPWEIYFVPAVCTTRGIKALEAECPTVQVSAGNVLDEKYSVFHEKSLVWPEELAERGREMIERVSERLKLPTDGEDWDYRGFRLQGLAIGFDHKTPDATIPLFRLGRDDWAPLVRGA